MDTTTDPMADTTADPIGYLVHERTTRSKRYVVGSNRSGRGLVVSENQADAHRFEDRGEAEHVATLALAQYRGAWGITVLYPTRQPTWTPEEIAARIAARRATRA